MKRLLVILVIACFSGNISAQTPLSVAKDFSAKDIVGTTHHLFDYLDNNKFVLLDFFTTACGSCQTYAPEVSAAYSDFGCNTGNLVVLGINRGSNNASVHDFDSAFGVFFPSVSGTQGGGNRVVDSFQVLSYPTVILIAPDRQILEQYIWPPSRQQLDSIIQTHGGLMQSCITGNETIIPPLTESELSIWPNPSAGIVNIGTKTGIGTEIAILSMQGQLIEKYPWDNNSGNQVFQVKEVFGLNAGMFIVYLKKDGIIIDASKLVINQ
jgi:thiol-disulfide isomerase/thioredoxin